MTPEQFEAKWGEALDVCVDWTSGGHSDRDEATARGLLVAWAAELDSWVAVKFEEDGENGWKMFRFLPDYRTVPVEKTFEAYDAALIAGCIALAKQEAAK